MTTLLDVDNLSVRLRSRSGPLVAVDHVSYQVHDGEFFGIAGESGSGKTLSALALLGLLPAGATAEGRALFANKDLLRMKNEALRRTRGGAIAMVLQDPTTSLHPMLTVGRQLTEHMTLHLGISQSAARSRAADLLEQVRIPDPEATLRAYPHQFSGGMRQRIAIAMALACGPKLLIADEPTTALDVTVQAEILKLLSRLREEIGLTLILITHDLGVLSSLADTVTVFYAGRVVESGPIRDIIKRPRHPYTQGLLDSLPHPERARTERLQPIPGTPPSLSDVPSGCAFRTRCKHAIGRCETEIPELRAIGSRRLACHVDPAGGTP